MVAKNCLVLILIAIMLVPFLIEGKAATLVDVERQSSVSVVNNEDAYLSISVTTPILVSEGEILGTQLLVLANKLSDSPMYLSTVLPLSVTEEEYILSGVSYSAGPYYGGEECQVSITVEGITSGTYTEFFEVEAYWGTDYSSAVAIVHAYSIEVTIVVQTPA